MRASDRVEGPIRAMARAPSQEFLGPGGGARGLRPGGAGAPPPPSRLAPQQPPRDASPPRWDDSPVAHATALVWKPAPQASLLAFVHPAQTASQPSPFPAGVRSSEACSIHTCSTACVRLSSRLLRLQPVACWTTGSRLCNCRQRKQLDLKPRSSSGVDASALLPPAGAGRSATPPPDAAPASGAASSEQQVPSASNCRGPVQPCLQLPVSKPTSGFCGQNRAHLCDDVWETGT